MPTADSHLTPAAVDDPPPHHPADEKLLSEHLLPLVYEELRAMAATRMRNLAAGQTLQPTALVHEAWLRLSDGERTWESPGHFYRTAAVAMRRILMDRARAKASLKRAGGWERIDIAELDLTAVTSDEQLLLVDESLKVLERDDPLSAEIVMLKFFSGLSNKEAAAALGIGHATVERRWAFAKVCLVQILIELQGGPAA
ncbi:MAG TPA: ECF-type sigma factor [Luteolibacter sp.]